MTESNQTISSIQDNFTFFTLPGDKTIYYLKFDPDNMKKFRIYGTDDGTVFKDYTLQPNVEIAETYERDYEKYSDLPYQAQALLHLA